MIANQSDSTDRSADVEIESNVTFEDMMLNADVLTGLSNGGFRKPTPIQLRAIPIGRCGFGNNHSFKVANFQLKQLFE